MSIKLGVNIDHIATLRNARGGGYPNPVRAVEFIKKAGAEIVTFHLREDRRHINDRDISEIFSKQNRILPINMEMAATDEMLSLALKFKPDYVCIVPERRNEITTEGGLNLSDKTLFSKLQLFIEKLKDNSIKVSLFLDPNMGLIADIEKLQPSIVEIHTGSYANSFYDENPNEIQIKIDEIKKFAVAIRRLGIECHAGHGLNYENIAKISLIKEITVLHIGHFLIGESIFLGIEAATKQMVEIVLNARNA